MGQAAIGGDITKDGMTRIRRKYLVCESCDGLLGISPNQLYVSPGYLEAMRVPLKAGRYFANSDGKSLHHGDKEAGWK